MLKINSKDAKSDLPKPLYAAAGAGELAYQQLRRLPEVAARTMRTAGHTAGEFRQRIASRPEPVGERMRKSAERGRSAMRATAVAAQERAVAGYWSLVARGEKVMADRDAAAGRSEPAKVEVIVGSPESAAESGEPPAQPTTGPAGDADSSAPGTRGGKRATS